ncbi:MAG: hypothetical protein QM479_02875 [Pseudomonadota bacterium]
MYLIYGTIAIFLITFFMGYVYYKKSRYGIILAVISLLLIALAVYWNLSEDSRDLKSAQKISLEQIQLSQPSLNVAYGNRYLYQALIKNQSTSSQLISVQLQLSLFNSQANGKEQLNKNIKIWLAANKSEQIKAYFSSAKLAKKLNPEQWQVIVIAVKAR